MNKLNKLKFVNLRGVNIFEHLRWEEILFRHTKENWLVWNTGPEQPTIVVGYSGKVPELVNTDIAKRDNIPVIRRYTGGGTVIVDKSTIFLSLIMNSTHVDSLAYPRNIMNWSESIYGPVFGRLIDCEESFALREHDYVIGNVKIGGNAQSITKNRWVHHTSFLWDYETENMKYLAMPNRRPDYRADRDHKDFLGKLNEFIPTKHHFLAHTLEELSNHFEVEEIDNLDDFHHAVNQAMGEKTLDQLARTKYEAL